jgi:Holliday junction resolvase RusA-like endonuclease
MYNLILGLLGIDILDVDTIYDIDIIPMGYVRRTRADAWKGREVVKKYYEYKNTLGYLLNRMGYKQGQSLHIAFLLPIPNSISKKKYREYNLSLHNKKPDIDNLVKAFLDTVCKQDNFISRINCIKLYSTNPKIIIFAVKQNYNQDVSISKAEYT